MSFDEGESITLEKFVAMTANIPRPKWVGFTVNSEMYRRLLSGDRFTPDELDFGLDWTRNILFEVPGQKGEIVGWSDREDLNLYLEMMGVRATERAERKQALHVIAGHSSVGLSEIVARTVRMPDHHLVVASRMIGNDSSPSEIFEEFAKGIAKKFVESKISAFLGELKSDNAPGKKKKRRQVQHVPFYAKFTRRSRR